MPLRLFRRHVEHVGAGLRTDVEGLGRSHKMAVGIDDIDAKRERSRDLNVQLCFAAID